MSKDKIKAFLSKACHVGWKLFKFVAMVALYTAVQAFLMTHVGIIVPSLEFFMDRLYKLSKDFYKWVKPKLMSVLSKVKNKVCIDDKGADLEKEREEKILSAKPKPNFLCQMATHTARVTLQNVEGQN